MNNFKANIEYNALVTTELAEEKFERKIQTLNTKHLPEGEVLIKVLYSSLNYKDALSACGHKGISRYYPHTPGVDAAGIVVESLVPDLQIGDEVIVTGHDLGMNTFGGFGEYISVPSGWCVLKPKNLTFKQSMIYGTAAMTAAMCAYEIVNRPISTTQGKLLVTGATGGVGSMAVAIASKIGYDVIASTGKMDKSEWLKNIGAKEVIHRSEVFDTTGRPLLAKRWAAAIDTVGGNTLSTVIRSTDHHGAVCVLGLVESSELNINLFPFLMRGITIFGIDSAERGIELKKQLWDKLSNQWRPKMLDDMCKEVNLEHISDEIDLILKGGQVGKVVLKHRD